MRRNKRLMLSCMMVAVAFMGPTAGCVDDLVGPSGSSSGSYCGKAGQACPCCSGFSCEARIGSPVRLCRKPCVPGFIGCR
jgi:hypothetical protein